PPLRTEEDVEAIIEGLSDGTIDVIATDHAPHSWEEKAAEFNYAPFGIVGLETVLGLSATRLLDTNKLKLKTCIEKFTLNPYKILGLEAPSIKKGNFANLSIFDVETEWTFNEINSLSKSTNSPFTGWTLKGKPHAVINNNQIFMSIL
ncbi:MAG: amidohydrolase family protein, partial [Planctomycetota bacterium]